MNIVGYGGGTNSTAMLIGLYHRKIPVDLILFSNTGGEQPHTYDFLPIMDRWLEEHGLPTITQVEYTDRNGERLTLEQECLRSGSLPAIAYGYKKCSLKHKVAPQDKFCNNYPPCREAWARGERIVKFIGFDIGEQKRRDHAQPIDDSDTKYKQEYPLMDWGWTREDCVTAIQQEGLPLPGKSSCFFCPSMKKREIRTLYHQHRDLYDRAIAIEDGARPNLITVKGLGRNWAWRDFVEADLNQTAMCWMFPEDDLPCNCHDGG
jgi:hypothetical protein|nr:hypothetical protein [uncultured Acetatifactor sp.]